MNFAIVLLQWASFLGNILATGGSSGGGSRLGFVSGIEGSLVEVLVWLAIA